MLEPREKVIEDFGLYFEQYGLPRILGRIYGLLMITDEHALGLDDMAEQLGISKASASRRGADICLESKNTPTSGRDKITAAATTGPAKQPRPTSSTPITGVGR